MAIQQTANLYHADSSSVRASKIIQHEKKVTTMTKNQNTTGTSEKQTLKEIQEKEQQRKMKLKRALSQLRDFERFDPRSGVSK